MGFTHPAFAFPKISIKSYGYVNLRAHEFHGENKQGFHNAATAPTPPPETWPSSEPGSGCVNTRCRLARRWAYDRKRIVRDGLLGTMRFADSAHPTALVAFGENRTRYSRAADLQKYSGVAPVTERSGKKHWVHWRWECPTFLRQTFVEWAAQTINKSYWAGQYYRQQRAKGCTYQATVRALALKWIRILYRCWQTGKPYDESTYLKALERRSSPLLKQASETS